MSLGSTATILPFLTRGGNTVWKIFINGKDVTEEILHIKLVSDKFGGWEFGLRDGSFPGFIIIENGGGGVVMLPYCIIDGVLYVGILEQHRDNMYGKHSVSAGFLHKGEKREAGRKREGKEEIGHLADRCFDLNPDRGICANRAHYYTPTVEAGLSIHGIPVEKNELTTEDGKIYRLNKGLFDPTDAEAERISGCIFVPADVATYYMQDDFLHISLSLLRLHLFGDKSDLEHYASIFN